MTVLPVRSTTHERMLTLRRRATNDLVTVLSVAATIIVLVPLIAIFGYLLYKARVR